jgi:hypothetical protein
MKTVLTLKRLPESFDSFGGYPVTSHKSVSVCQHLFLLGLLLFIPSITAAKEKKQPPAEPYALLMITCVNDKGLSLPGTGITVQMQLSPGQRAKRTQWEGTSDVRGEAAFRLPAGRNSFLVKASRAGYHPHEKTVAFAEDERQDILFTMESLSTQP